MLNPDDLQLLSDYLDDALSAEERAALEARLQADAELSRELARLRATVELLGTLPTLSAPRSFALTPRMARRPTILTSAAFSAMSAAAAVVLLVIGAALFSIRTPQAAPVLDEVAFAPTLPMTVASALRDTNIPAQADTEVEPFALKSETEVPAESLAVMLPTGTPAPEIAPQLNAVASTPVPSGESELYAAAPSDAFDQAAGSTLSQADAAQETDDQLRFAAEEPPSAASGAAAQAPLPAPTLLPPGTATAAPTFAPSATSTKLPTSTQTALPATTTAIPSLTPTLVPTPAPLPASPSPDANTVGIGLIAAAVVLFGAAVVTTLLRRRG
jgi:hypothetical protein